MVMTVFRSVQPVQDEIRGNLGPLHAQEVAQRRDDLHSGAWYARRALAEVLLRAS